MEGAVERNTAWKVSIWRSTGSWTTRDAWVSRDSVSRRTRRGRPTRTSLLSQGSTDWKFVWRKLSMARE